MTSLLHDTQTHAGTVDDKVMLCQNIPKVDTDEDKVMICQHIPKVDTDDDKVMLCQNIPKVDTDDHLLYNTLQLNITQFIF